MKKILVVISIIFLLLFMGCTQSIKEIKKDENIGKIVSVKGTVTSTIKIGSLSGYILKDEAGDSIAVSSKVLPKDESKITVSGELIKIPIFGYYIDTDK